jgi:hypothetical protein
MSDLAPVLGLLAGGLAVADTVPYLRDMVRGTTRPHRGTWLIWGVMAIVVCASQWADGATWSLIMAVAQAFVTTLIFLLAIRRGEGGVGPTDLALLAVAMGGVVGWVVADEPIVATGCVVAADLIGVALMVPKTYRDPGSETLATYAFASLGGLLATAAVETAELALLLYPVYYCLVNGAIAVLIMRRRAATGPKGEMGSVDEPVAVRDGRGLATGIDIELPQDVRDVHARGLVADEQRFRDLAVALARRDQPQDFLLSGRERWRLLEWGLRDRADVDPGATGQVDDLLR